MLVFIDFRKAYDSVDREVLWECLSRLGPHGRMLQTLKEMYQEAGMLSPEGRCKTLDTAADGYVRAEACGTLLLQLLTHGISSDAFLAVLAGAAVNQDGRSSSLTAPNGPAQQQAVGAALRDAGQGGGDLCTLQMHGTGTPLGDPIELGAAAAVLCGGGAKGTYSLGPAPTALPLALSASKSWMGHAEPAAGVVGVLHAAAALARRVALPLLHLRQLSEHATGAVLAAGGGAGARGVRAPRQLGGDCALMGGEGTAMAGVSAFAFQGTNAHVLLQALSSGAAAGGSGSAAASGKRPVVWGGREWLWVTLVASPLLHRFASAAEGASSLSGPPLALEAADLVAAATGVHPYSLPWQAGTPAPMVMFEAALGKAALAPTAGLCVTSPADGGYETDASEAAEQLLLAPPSLALAAAAVAVRAADTRAPGPEQAVVLCGGRVLPQVPEPRGTYLASSLVVVLWPGDGGLAVLVRAPPLEEEEEVGVEEVGLEELEDGVGGQWEEAGGGDGWWDDSGGEMALEEEREEELSGGKPSLRLLLAARVSALPQVADPDPPLPLASGPTGSPPSPAASPAMRLACRLLAAAQVLPTAITRVRGDMLPGAGDGSAAGRMFGVVAWPAGVEEADVAAVCMAEAALQLRGAGLLCGFDGWVVKGVGSFADGGV